MGSVGAEMTSLGRYGDEPEKSYGLCCGLQYCKAG